MQAINLRGVSCHTNFAKAKPALEGLQKAEE